MEGDTIGADDVDGDVMFLDAGEFEIELITYEAPANENVHNESAGHDVGIAYLCLEVIDVWNLYVEYQTRDVATFVEVPKTVSNGKKITDMYDPMETTRRS